MKSLLLNLLLGFVISGLFQQCTPISFYQDDIQYLTEIPLKEQKQDYTKIYFPDDLKPERPYIEAGIVRIRTGGYPNTKQLSQELRDKAQRLGLDAVFVGEKYGEGSRGANVGEALVMGTVEGVVSGALGQEVTTSSVDEFETYSHFVLEGVGIKYLDNIHNIENSVKSEQVFLAKKPDEPLYSKEFFLNGETKSIDFQEELALHIHNNYVEAFSLHHLMKQQANWGYRLYENKVIKREFYKASDWKLKTIRFIYDFNNSNSLKKIVIRYPGQEKKDVIRMTTNLGVVEGKKIYQQGVMTMKENLIYDDIDRLIKREIFKVEDDVESLWLVAYYDYFKNSELKDYLKKPEDKTVNE